MANHACLPAQTAEAKKNERIWRLKAEQLSKQLENQQEDSKDITADLKRQLKVLEEQSGSRVSELEKENKDLRKQLEEMTRECQRLKVEQQSAQHSHMTQVHEYQRKLDLMKTDFATMLRDTIVKMQEKLEGTHNSTLASVQTQRGMG